MSRLDHALIALAAASIGGIVFCQHRRLRVLPWHRRLLARVAR